MYSVKLFDKEVQNPLARLIVTTVAFAIGTTLGIIIILISIPVHFLLIMAGRQGFFSKTSLGGREYIVGKQGFQKKVRSFNRKVYARPIDSGFRVVIARNFIEFTKDKQP